MFSTLVPIASLALGTFFVFVSTVDTIYKKETTTGIPISARAIASLADDAEIYLMSFTGGPALHYAYNADLDIVSNYFSLWMYPYIARYEREEVGEYAVYSKLRQLLLESVQQYFLENTPRYILADKRAGQGSISGDILEYFRKQELTSDIFNKYMLIDDALLDYNVYEHKSFSSR